MLIAEVHAVDAGAQIGGGAGYVAEQIREARADALLAMKALADVPDDALVIPPHPREAAIAAAREAVIHLNEALNVEAPEDAIMDTRHALEELVGTITTLERMGQGIPARPGDPAAGRFGRALTLLVTAEHKLHEGNTGIVPPWLP